MYFEIHLSSWNGYQSVKDTAGPSQYEYRILPLKEWNSHCNIRRSHDSHLVIKEILIRGKTVFILRQGPGRTFSLFFLCYQYAVVPETLSLRQTYLNATVNWDKTHDHGRYSDTQSEYTQKHTYIYKYSESEFCNHLQMFSYIISMYVLIWLHWNVRWNLVK